MVFIRLRSRIHLISIFDLALQNFDIQNTVKTFSTVKKLLLLQKGVMANFRLHLMSVARWMRKMDPVYLHSMVEES